MLRAKDLMYPSYTYTSFNTEKQFHEQFGKKRGKKETLLTFPILNPLTQFPFNV